MFDLEGKLMGFSSEPGDAHLNLHLNCFSKPSEMSICDPMINDSLPVLEPTTENTPDRRSSSQYNEKDPLEF